VPQGTFFVRKTWFIIELNKQLSIGVNMDKLFEPIRYLKGIGPQREKQLNKLGINDIFDLFWHIPRAYLDRSRTTRIKDLEIGAVQAICGTVGCRTGK
jgi:RecG-like helicase